MDYAVEIAPRAIEDLKDIVFYISPDRPEAAQRLAFALIDRTKALADLPFMGRVVPEFGDPMIRELILQPYRIVYRIDETRRRIGVARFWHGHRQAIGDGDLV